jgi:anti-sigma regulatory factor (Ser/Thr protein kinase)
MPLNERFKLRLPPSPEAPAAARGAVRPLAGAVEPDVLESVRLLVSELVTNAVRHAGLRGDDWIELRVEADEEAVWVGVSDPGQGFDRLPAQPQLNVPTGWGLYLVNELADRWGVERRDATLVWFRIDRPTPGNGWARPH